MKKQRYAVFLALVLAVCMLAGCGASSAGSATFTENGAGDLPMEGEAPGMPEQGLTDAAGGQTGLMQPESSRKIIYNAELELESKAFDDTLSALLEETARAGGYIQSSSAGGSAENGTRWANYTLRIPAQQYSAFLQAAEGAGNLVHKSEQTEDVTAQYVDVQARLSSLNAQHDRLLELMAQAERLEDVLAIQNQLTEVEYQLDSYTAQLRTYDGLVELCTVTVSLSEVQTLTVTPTSFGSRVGEAFRSSWKGFATGCQDFAVGLVYALPTLLVLALLAVVLAQVVRVARRRAAARPRPAVPPRAPGQVSYEPLYRQKPSETSGQEKGGQEE